VADCLAGFEGAMKFFEGKRGSAYLQAARLKCDRKTGIRSWQLTLAITMSSALAHVCAEAIVSNYAQISTEENRCSALDIAEEPPLQRLEFFDLEGGEAQVSQAARLSLSHWSISGLRMTKVEGLVELWALCEHVNTDQLHRFVKDYAFTRMSVGFVPNQQSPDAAPVVVAAADHPQENLADLVARIEQMGATEIAKELITLKTKAGKKKP
jgi:hypothetical protein